MKECASALPGTYYMDPPDGGDVSIPEQIRRMAKDAARYRWLRERDFETISRGGVFAGMTPENIVLNQEDLDAEIDAAQKEQRNERPHTTRTGGAGGGYQFSYSYRSLSSPAVPVILAETGRWRKWDPRHDDGDALRLAVLLNLEIHSPQSDPTVMQDRRA